MTCWILPPEIATVTAIQNREYTHDLQRQQLLQRFVEAVFKRLAPAGFEAVRGKLTGSQVSSN